MVYNVEIKALFFGLLFYFIGRNKEVLKIESLKELMPKGTDR